jgi:hypothetical protein
LIALQPSMELWFETVASDPLPFIIPGRPFLSFYDKHFRDLVSGVWPSTVLDEPGFSPLTDMLNGYVCHLWCDRVLTTGSPMDRKFLLSYFQLCAQAIDPTTYFGARLPARFCPNYVYHFKIANGWPTDATRATTQGFLHEFEHLPLILWQAQLYDRINVDLNDQTTAVLLPF